MSIQCRVHLIIIFMMAYYGFGYHEYGTVEFIVRYKLEWYCLAARATLSVVTATMNSDQLYCTMGKVRPT